MGLTTIGCTGELLRQCPHADVMKAKAHCTALQHGQRGDTYGDGVEIARRWVTQHGLRVICGELRPKPKPAPVAKRQPVKIPWIVIVGAAMLMAIDGPLPFGDAAAVMLVGGRL